MNLDYISLVNLVLNKKVVTELIQDACNTSQLEKELTAILDHENRKKFFIHYYELEKVLGGQGASKNTAKLILNSINSNSVHA